MSLSVTHVENLNYLLIEITGKWSHDDGQKIVSEISTYLSPRHKGRVLIDTRAQERNTSTLSTYNEAKDIAANLLGYRIRVAILSTPKIDHLGVFLETVARNRGIDLMVFQVKHKARRWLMGKVAT